MSLNILLSLALLWRILDLRRRLPGTLAAAAALVGSALPLGLLTAVFVVSYGAHSNGAHLFVSLLVQLEVHSALLCSGRAPR